MQDTTKRKNISKPDLASFLLNCRLWVLFFKKSICQMSVVNINGNDVKISFSDYSINVDEVINCKKFNDWIENIDPDFDIKEIDIQSVDKFGSKIGFIKLKSIVRSKITGKNIPGIVFLRGGSVAILIVLKSNGRKYTILTRQARFPIGKPYFKEIPAGMIDDEDNFTGVAAKELEEETGITIKAEQLLELSKFVSDGNGLYPSPGGCDEIIKLYLYEKDISEAELKNFQGKQCGELNTSEHIILEVIPLDELWKSTSDMKAICALHLYSQLKN